MGLGLKNQNKCHDQSVFFVVVLFLIFSVEWKIIRNPQWKTAEAKWKVHIENVYKKKEGKIIFIVVEGWLKVERKIRKKKIENQWKVNSFGGGDFILEI